MSATTVAEQRTSGSMTRRRFTVDEYERMATAGILTEDDRVELIDGEVVEMSPIDPPHASGVKRLNRLLGRQLGDSALIGVQDPVQLSRFAAPQPDLSVLRPRADDYAQAHPTPADIFFVIEVADSSLETDRKVKLPLYARAEIPEVWLVDLNGERIERHTEPRNGAYRRVDVATRGETIVSAALPALALEVDAILGPRPAPDG
jgi:Uma2 family endonuclease